MLSNDDQGEAGSKGCDLKCLEKDNDDDRVDTETDTNNNGVPDKPDTLWEIPPSGDTCQYASLVECLYSGGAWPDGDYTFTDDEWADFTLALYMDVHRRERDGFWTIQYNPEHQKWPFAPFHNENYNHRGVYDTPFWDHYGKYSGDVCFNNGECHNRNDVNYIAQGMWSAAAGEGKFGGEFIANLWKKRYGHEASPEVLYWVGVGVDLYKAYDFSPSP